MFIIIFIAIWAACIGAWLLSGNASHSADVEKFKHRLLGSSARAKSGKHSAKPLIQTDASQGPLVRIMARMRLRGAIERLIEQAGVKWSTAQFLQRSILFSIGAYAILYLTLPQEFRPFEPFAAIAAAFLPLLQLLRARSIRLKKFEEIFPDSLEFVARSMRAGHAFSVSLEMIHREFQEPLAGEFRRAFEEHNLGLPLDVALQKLATRVPSLDVHFFVSAVILQKRTGGNLAEILDKLAQIIRERFKLRGKIRAISAHGRMTGMALTLIPLGVAVLMFIVNPDYVRFFFRDETGNYMLAGAVVLQLIGYAVIQKIVSIEV